MPDNPNQRIQPEEFAPTASDAKSSGQNSPQQDQANQNSPFKKSPGASILTWSVIAVLVLLALVIVFIPMTNDDQQEPPVASQNTDQQIEQVISESTPEETPWADAQLLKARRDAQEILSELLGVQKRLEAVQVERWAPDELNAIQSAAELGDSLYKERQFEPSLEKYREALDAALRLDASIPEVALQYQQQGKQLLEQNSPQQALVDLELSNLLMPDTEATLALIQQASVRDQVLLLIEQSNSLARDENQLEDAKLLLVEAQTLDSEYAPLNGHIDEVDEKILERDFRQAMSKGFTSLSDGYFKQAADAFNQAAQLKPDSSAPTEALQQVEAAKLNTQRQASLDRALELEAKEQWEAALATYSSLLQEDGSLTSAQLGKIRSQTRFNLDSDIENILSNPLSLQSERKWQSASKTLMDARGIINAGQRLNHQIDQLQKLLVVARTPVVLKLNSDGLTDVEIYRVGKLGTFTEQAMNLNPGKYVIVGRRNGYQDVRVELSIDGSKPEIRVPVICTVTI